MNFFYKGHFLKQNCFTNGSKKEEPAGSFSVISNL